MRDSAKNYHPKQNPYEPGKLFVEEKVLDGGLILKLECKVSAIEFVGTPTYTLHLERPGFSMEGASIGPEEIFIPRPWSAMLSEAAYRLAMARINSEEDFYKIKEELVPLTEGLVKRLYEMNNPNPKDD